MSLHKITFSDGKSVVVRKATMQDKRVSAQDLENNKQSATGERVLENLLRFIIVEAYDKDNKKIDIGHPPVNVDKLLDLQQYHELLDALGEHNLIVDTKKKAKVEKVPTPSSTT